MLFRAIALSLALLIGIGFGLPLATNYTEAGPKKQRKKKNTRSWKGVKKYSKKWWQLYRAQERRKASLAKRKRSLRARQMTLAKIRENEDMPAAKTQTATASAPVETRSAAATLPSGERAPQGWNQGESSRGELNFRVDDEKGSAVGSASITVVGPAISEDSGNTKSRMVGGVSTASLRRTVIDRMIKEEGWVVNDFQRQIGGKNVYVVVAQSPGPKGALMSRMFYFTEVDGRIYSVATNAPQNSSGRLEEESEKVILSLHRKRNGAQQASTR